MRQECWHGFENLESIEICWRYFTIDSNEQTQTDPQDAHESGHRAQLWVLSQGPRKEIGRRAVWTWRNLSVSALRGAVYNCSVVLVEETWIHILSYTYLWQSMQIESSCIPFSCMNLMNVTSFSVQDIDPVMTYQEEQELRSHCSFPLMGKDSWLGQKCVFIHGELWNDIGTVDFAVRWEA